MINAQRQAVVDSAKSWLLTPYHHKAAIKGAGVDCAQILLEVYYEAGVTKDRIDVGNYTHDWMLHRSEEVYLGWLYKYGNEVHEAKPGDTIIWKVGRCFSHAAIVVDWPLIIHAYRKEKAVVYGDATKGEFCGKEKRIISYWDDLE